MRRGLLIGGLVLAALALAWGVLSLAKPAWFLRGVYPLSHVAAIRAAARKNDLDPALVAAVIYEESHFHDHVSSHQGAVGLMQVMPSTAQDIARSTGGDWLRRDRPDRGPRQHPLRLLLPAPAARPLSRLEDGGGRRLQRRRGQRRCVALDGGGQAYPAGHPVQRDARLRHARAGARRSSIAGPTARSWGRATAVDDCERTFALLPSTTDDRNLSARSRLRAHGRPAPGGRQPARTGVPAATATRRCSASRARARRSPWPTSSPGRASRRW